MGVVNWGLPRLVLIRVVNEAHSAATKKNREWLEKLPTVVLKAEEIMYSKANSEVLLVLSTFFCGFWVLGFMCLFVGFSMVGFCNLSCCLFA